MSPSTSCEVCSKVFSFPNSMYRHRKKVHGSMKLPTTDYICDSCGFKCIVKKVLISHIRRNHPQQRKNGVPGTRLKCPKCDSHVVSYESLDQHLISKHEINIQEEYFEFETEGDFRVWKSDLEKRTGAEYSAERGIRRRKSHSQREFICHRSYGPKIKSSNRKRAVKSLATNKIGAACPSRMIVKITKEKITVNFISIHVGHIAEVIRMRIPSDQRAEIAGKLKSGMTVQQALDDIRDSGDRENFQRIHYIQKKDVHNIIRDYKIGNMTRLHEDGVSVDILVETLRKMEDSPLLYYNSNYENFSLILMTPFQRSMLLEHSKKIYVDGTDGLNAYGYQLISILVIDEFNNGVPVAFCFSKKTDFDAMFLFFAKVKDAVGCPVKTEIFMSDDAPQFFDAWTAVMGKPSHKLTCWWHVNKNWTSMLNNKINDATKRKHVRDALYSLATSTAVDADQFESQLTAFLNTLRDDEDTQSFYDYFRIHYVPKKTAWAFCFRKHLGLNVNMHLESLHKKLQYHYLDGKKCSRLDKSINAVLKMVRDVMYQRIIKTAKEQPCNKLLKIRSAHTKRTKISDQDVHVIESELWHVKSQTHEQLRYKVQRISENCQENNLCVLRCSECDVCIHNFKCSCVDSVIDLNICKHIHKVAEMLNVSRSSDGCDKENEIIEIEETMDMLTSHPQMNNVGSDDDEKKKVEVDAKLRLLLQWNADLSKEERMNLCKMLDKAMSKLKFAKKNKKRRPPSCKYRTT